MILDLHDKAALYASAGRDKQSGQRAKRGPVSTSNRKSEKVEYVPPPLSEVKAFAKAVCDGMAEKKQNAVFTKPETVDGFAEFLHILLTIEAKRRNRAQFDSGS